MVDNSVLNPPSSLTYSGGFRVTPYPTVYGDLKTPWQFDMELMGILAAWLMVSFAMLVILPTLRPRKDECGPFWFSFFYLWVGGLLMLAIYGHGWQEGYLDTRTFYISNSNLYIDARVGIQVGLRGINVTLVGNPLIQANHTINYNERFWWGGEDVALPQLSWGQGKEGFGSNGGQYNQEFKRQLEKGVPWPILWVAEWLTVDAEYIRWGRYYRMAGYYSFQLAWTAWCVWLLNLFVFLMAPIWGFLGLTLVGSLMVIIITIYGGLVQTVHSRIGALTIPFETGNLVATYSWSFYFTLFVGIACIIAGIVGLVTLTATKKEEAITFHEGPNSTEMKEVPPKMPAHSPSANNNNWQQPVQQPVQQPQYNYNNNVQYNYNNMQQQPVNQPYIPPRPKGVNEIQFHH